MRLRQVLLALGAMLGMLVAAVWLMGVGGCFSESAKGSLQGGETEDSELLDPPLVTVQKRSWPRQLRIQGNLVEAEAALVGTEVAGRVQRVHVDVGSTVQAGQLLVELDAEDYRLQEQLVEAQVQAIRARIGLMPGQSESDLRPENAPPVLQEKAVVEESRLALERATLLHRINRNAISAEELERLQAALKVAEARYASALNQVREQLALLQLRKVELEQARKQVRETQIRAPFSGVVQTRPPAPGTYLRVGDGVVRLVRLDMLRFRGKVPDRYILHLRPGLSLQVFVEGFDKPFSTHISRIEPMLDPATLMRIVEADVPNPDCRLPANTFAEADLLLDAQAQALVVPRSAVWEFAGVERVWKIENDRLVERRVQAGETRGEWVEIVGGLVEGDTILADARLGRANRKVVRKSP